MTPQQRLDHARAYIAELRDLAAALPDHHELQVLGLHDQALAHVDGDSWFLGRLLKPEPGFFTELIRGLLDIYAPHNADQPATDAPLKTQEATA